MLDEKNFWRKCSSCKNPIAFKAKHYVCSVSTCNALRTGYAFCSVPCFEKHLPGARHRDAAAIEKQAGATPYNPDDSGAQRKFAVSTPIAPTKNQIPREVLVVVSKLKDYIKARADMNTSQSVVDVLSDQIREMCDEAIDKARADQRKTLLDRDFKK